MKMDNIVKLSTTLLQIKIILITSHRLLPDIYTNSNWITKNKKDYIPYRKWKENNKGEQTHTHTDSTYVDLIIENKSLKSN